MFNSLVLCCAAAAVTDHSSHANIDFAFILAPAAVPAKQALNLVNLSKPQPYGSETTWGGSVVRDAKTPGLYHMYASTFQGACGLAAWETNSRVVHATSTDGAGGPFTVQSTVVDAFAHNPEVVYDSRSKLYLLFTLGGNNRSAPVPCTNHTPIEKWGGEGAPPWLYDVRLHTATDPAGPFEAVLNKTTAEPAVIATGLNANPTASVNPDTGEITLLHGSFIAGSHVREYVVQRAARWDAPFKSVGVLGRGADSIYPPHNCSTNSSSPWYKCPCNNEDPHLYWSAASQRWRLLFHQYTLGLEHGKPCPAASDVTAGPDPSIAAVGGYAESNTADILGKWTYNYFKPAYSMQVEWDSGGGGSSAGEGSGGAEGGGGVIIRRERPKVLLNPDSGEPEYLYNGVGLGLNDGTLGAGSYNTLTFVQRILGVHR